MKNVVVTLWLITGFSAMISGQNPSDFTLFSATDDSQFNLKEARGKYVALHFLLKTECPVCARFTHEYAENAHQLPNVVQVFIKPDTEEEIRQWTGRLSSEDLERFRIYRDPGAQLAKEFNIPDGYEFHNQVVHYPALVLLDPSGKEVFRYVGRNNRDRFGFKQLLDKIWNIE
jgi:peroxiredoxin Q/BCP